MKTSEQINEIAEALSKAQGQMKGAEKDGRNPHFKSKYMTLDAVWHSIREALSANGLSAVQDVTNWEGGIAVETRILHKSGQWLQFGPLNMPSSKTDVQAFGSCTSYGKRYSLCAALGIVGVGEEDDDGEGAMVRESKISESQLSMIRESIAGDKERESKICSFYRVSSLEDMNSSQADAAIKYLKK